MAVYYTILPIESVIYKDKSSKFIGFAFAITDEFELKNKLLYVHNLHPKATHHCYAYRLGLDKNNYRTNDDGEPNGTAGKPILGQIDSFNITNTLVIAVRYFGGIKLGVSGLITAYKECARLTLQSTIIVEHKLMVFYQITCCYESINKVYKICQAASATIVEQQLNSQSTFIINIEQTHSVLFEKQLMEAQLEYRFIEIK